MIEDMGPSDGGLYSCMAVSASGNASRDVAIHSKTQLPSLNQAKYFQMTFPLLPHSPAWTSLLPVCGVRTGLGSLLTQQDAS